MFLRAPPPCPGSNGQRVISCCPSFISAPDGEEKQLVGAEGGGSIEKSEGMEWGGKDCVGWKGTRSRVGGSGEGQEGGMEESERTLKHLTAFGRKCHTGQDLLITVICGMFQSTRTK